MIVYALCRNQNGGKYSTLTKTFSRNPVCRLCRDSYESRCGRIFSKAGSSKDLWAEVHKTCGIKISEDDTGSSKMEQFIQKAQSIENTPSDPSSQYAVKQCVQLSPLLQPSKRFSTNMWSERSETLASVHVVTSTDGVNCRLQVRISLKCERTWIAFLFVVSHLRDSAIKTGSWDFRKSYLYCSK